MTKVTDMQDELDLYESHPCIVPDPDTRLYRSGTVHVIDYLPEEYQGTLKASGVIVLPADDQHAETCMPVLLTATAGHLGLPTTGEEAFRIAQFPEQPHKWRREGELYHDAFGVSHDTYSWGIGLVGKPAPGLSPISKEDV